MLRPLLCVAALLALGGAAAAQTATLRQIVDDVVLDAVLTPDGLIACFTTIGGAKLSGVHGIVITAQSDPSLWNESLPKRVSVETDYFQLPLRIDLQRRPG